MRIYLVRHGETTDNANGIISGGGRQGTLTKRGITQAKVAGEFLRRKRISAIYSSDLRRTVQTATVISEVIGIRKVNYTPDLREIHYGPLEGKLVVPEDWVKIRQKAYAPGVGYEGVERIEDAKERVVRILKDVELRYPLESVLLVLHSGIGRVVITTLKGQPLEEVAKMDRLPNGKVMEFDVNPWVQIDASAMQQQNGVLQKHIY